MKIQQIKLSKLKPYPKNAKIHTQSQIEALAKEISEVGWTQAIVVDSEFTIVAGHKRRLAAIHLGLEQVPVRILDSNLTAERIRASRLFDNKIAETEWDTALLNEELFALSQVPDFDFSMTGFEMPNAFEDKPTKGAEGAKELSQEDFENFDHECPKCGFQWGQNES